MKEKSDDNVKVIKIKIADKDYLLKVKSDEEENYYFQLAAYIDKTMGKIKMHAPIGDFKNLLLLTCLTLADEILNSPNSNFNFVNQKNLEQAMFNKRLSKILNKIKNHEQEN